MKTEAVYGQTKKPFLTGKIHSRGDACLDAAADRFTHEIFLKGINKLK